MVSEHDRTTGRNRVQILLLEDSSMDAELTMARLEKTELEPVFTVARDKQSFLHELQARRYDLVLADYALPDFDGLTALEATRRNAPNVPFIFISGRVGEETAIDTLHRGATDYVLKSRLERLVPAVTRALKESEEHTTRMRAEALFRESEMRFRHVIDALPQMVWITDTDGRLRYSNQVWKTNAPPGLEHWCDPSLIHQDDLPLCSAMWRNARTRGESLTMELRILRHPDNTFRWNLIRLNPIQMHPEDEGEQRTNWLGTATDLQEQKLNEEALRTAEKLAVTGRMAAAIAHEINNPLESLTNLIFLVRMESATNSKALQYLEMADDELARISAITKQTLQFYRDPLVPVEMDAEDILREVMRLFGSRFISKKVKTDLQVTGGPIHFQAVKGEIRQVLINLLSNAIDACSPEGGYIHIFAQTAMVANAPMLQIKICDNGSGVPENQLERLFQPFFSTKGVHGTGLGLWVSRGIAEKHGGTLDLKTLYDDGSRITTATLTLPLVAVASLTENAVETA